MLTELADFLVRLFEAKKKKEVEEPVQEPQAQSDKKYNVRIIAGDMHVKSLKDVRHLKSIHENVSKVLNSKLVDPTKPANSRDYDLGVKGGFKDFPGLMHAAVSNNHRLWYYVAPVKKGKDVEHQVRLFGVYTHDQTGTGQPANVALQKATATRMSTENDKLAKQ